MSYFLRIDIHGHTAESAGKLLADTLRKLPDDVRELEIIHGYHQGTALREFIRKYKHPKIERKIIGLNQGTTIFIIKSGK